MSFPNGLLKTEVSSNVSNTRCTIVSENIYRDDPIDDDVIGLLIEARGGREEIHNMLVETAGTRMSVSCGQKDVVHLVPGSVL